MLAVALPGGHEHTVTATWPGRIASEELGDHGFGYDPVFLPDDGSGLSAAQLDADLKDAVSHRGQAVTAVLPHLRALLT